MLVVDIRRLVREGRYHLDGSLAADAPVWTEEDLRPDTGVSVGLDVQQVGADILAQGTIGGEIRATCRRCLEPVTLSIEEPVTLLYRHGAEPGEEDVYPLAERAYEVDLAPALREHWLLSAPAYVLCREACRGLCPHCGQDWNEGTCDCTVEETDSRWGPLLRLKEE